MTNNIEAVAKAFDEAWPSNLTPDEAAETEKVCAKIAEDEALRWCAVNSRTCQGFPGWGWTEEFVTKRFRTYNEAIEYVVEHGGVVQLDA